jgi:hypothetical protein
MIGGTIASPDSEPAAHPGEKPRRCFFIGMQKKLVEEEFGV